MKLVIFDLIFILLTGLLLFIVKLVADKLPATIVIKSQQNRTIFSLAKEKISWFLIIAGGYVWLMEFLILNDFLVLRLVTPLLLELSLFALLVVTGLGYRKWGERFTIIGFSLFLISVIYFVI